MTMQRVSLNRICHCPKHDRELVHKPWEHDGYDDVLVCLACVLEARTKVRRAMAVHDKYRSNGR